MDERAIPLKRNPRRTVERRGPDAASARPLVVKRYHHPGPFARLFDRSRAAQEFRLLRELDRRGVSVPRAVETRAAVGAFELVTEWIEDAVSLEDVARERSLAPAPVEILARRAGETLARAHQGGLAHRDLHPGNLVSQPGGRTWIVDVRGARIGRGFDPEVSRRDLVALASAVRERVSATLRARFLIAYARSLTRDQAARLAEVPRLARELESAARIHRREAVRRARKRWTRLSSVCRPVHNENFEGFASLEFDGGPLDLRSLVVLRDLSWRKLLGAWYAAARLAEHGIPCARPWALSTAPERFAAFALPASARPADRCAGAAQRKAIEIMLRDRGLALEGPSDELVRVAEDERAWVLPLVGVRLVDLHVEDDSP